MLFKPSEDVNKLIREKKSFVSQTHFSELLLEIYHSEKIEMNVFAFKLKAY